MKCEDQPACDDEDYAKAQSEQIDRGGLYHFKPEVYQASLGGGTDHQTPSEHVTSTLQRKDVNQIEIKCWREVTVSIPAAGYQVDKQRTQVS